MTSALNAVQYLRMSTEHQRYSLESQATTIAAYAALSGHNIIRSYSDGGKSGLRLSGRRGLQQLLADALKPDREFGTIFVLDVSRWGRFQDPDEAAHYEFICRAAGAKLIYVAEAFENDGGPVASIVKHLKRVMAAEYSRELATKVRNAHRRQAALGYSQGGIPPFGLRRQLVDIDGKPRAILRSGQRKALSDERVVWVKGPNDETDLIKELFRRYRAGISIPKLVQWLRHSKDAAALRVSWTYFKVHRILTNDVYVGTYVYPRHTKPFGGRALPVDPSERTFAKIGPPIVSPRLFRAVQKRLAERTHGQSDRQLLSRLSELMASRGGVSATLINDDAACANAATYIRRFGSLLSAYERIGHYPSRRVTFGRGRNTLTKPDMIGHLRRVHEANGYITAAMLAADQEAPCPASYVIHFGSLSDAYREAGLPYEHSEIQRAAHRRREERMSASAPLTQAGTS
jgi:DNA invertase Pin-like site-specific DNA recombinase